MIRRARLSLAVVLLLTAAAQTGSVVGAPAPNWELPDAKGTTRTLAQFAGQPLLLVGADKHSDAASERWGELLARQYAHRLRAVAVADLRAIPRLFRGLARTALQRRDTPSTRLGVPLLLDWDGKVAREYGLVPRTPNLVVIDAGGRVRAIITGEHGEERMREVARILENVLGSTPAVR